MLSDEDIALNLKELQAWVSEIASGYEGSHLKSLGNTLKPLSGKPCDSEKCAKTFDYLTKDLSPESCGTARGCLAASDLYMDLAILYQDVPPENLSQELDYPRTGQRQVHSVLIELIGCANCVLPQRLCTRDDRQECRPMAKVAGSPVLFADALWTPIRR